MGATMSLHYLGPAAIYSGGLHERTRRATGLEDTLEDCTQPYPVNPAPIRLIIKPQPEN